MDNNGIVVCQANRLEDSMMEFGTILPANSYLKKPWRIVDCFEEAEYEIDPDSISLSTRHNDIHDDLIFENDIINVDDKIMVVLWVPKELGFRAVDINNPNGYINFYNRKVFTIAPIHVYYANNWKEKKKEFLKEVQ